jgi:hypothetical protein
MKHLMIPVLLAGSLIALSTMEAGARCSAQGVLTGHDASGCPVNDPRQRPRLRSGERA